MSDEQSIFDECNIVVTPYYIVFIGTIASIFLTLFQLFGSQASILRGCKKKCCKKKYLNAKIHSSEQNLPPNYIDITIKNYRSPECIILSGIYKKIDYDKPNQLIYQNTQTACRRKLFLFFQKSLKNWIISFIPPPNEIYNNNNNDIDDNEINPPTNPIIPLATIGMTGTNFDFMKSPDTINIWTYNYILEPNVKIKKTKRKKEENRDEKQPPREMVHVSGFELFDTCIKKSIDNPNMVNMINNLSNQNITIDLNKDYYKYPRSWQVFQTTDKFLKIRIEDTKDKKDKNRTDPENLSTNADPNKLEIEGYETFDGYVSYLPWAMNIGVIENLLEGDRIQFPPPDGYDDLKPEKNLCSPESMMPYPFYLAICHLDSWYINKRILKIEDVDINFYNEISIVSKIISSLQILIALISLLSVAYQFYSDIKDMVNLLNFTPIITWKNFQCFSLIVANSGNSKNLFISALFNNIQYKINQERLSTLSKLTMLFYKFYIILVVPTSIVFGIPFALLYIWVSIGGYCVLYICVIIVIPWMEDDEIKKRISKEDYYIYEAITVAMFIALIFGTGVMVRLYNGENYWDSFKYVWNSRQTDVYWDSLKNDSKTIITFLNWIV